MEQAAMKENGSAEAINQLYLQALRKYEALKDDHDSLRKRHTDVISQYSAAASKLELSQVPFVPPLAIIRWMQ